MATYTSTLPDDLLVRLSELAREYGLPKNKLIERALDLYLRELDKAAFAKSFQKACGDEDLHSIAEEGMADYYKHLMVLEE